MPRFDQACTTCAWAGDVIAAPFVNPPCPACGGVTERSWTASAAVRGDEYPGGRVIENLGHLPVVVYSRSELTRIARARGLESFVRHTPLPGTDKSPHTTSWAASSPWMIEQARLLLERVGTQAPPRPEPPITEDVPTAFAGRVDTTPGPATIPRAAVAGVVRGL